MVADYSLENVMSGCGLRGKLGYQTRACFSSLHTLVCVSEALLWHDGLEI